MKLRNREYGTTPTLDDQTYPSFTLPVRFVAYTAGVGQVGRSILVQP